jgi:hypothetical protein
MTVDLYRLDSIEDYDVAIKALDSYMDDLMTEFVETPECQSYLTAYPEMAEYLGNWIYHLLYYGYNYQSVTLPQMKKTDVEEIVTELFPRKIVLQSPAEANNTIPELLAFWQFLQRVYKHPHAAKVITFLKQLQPKFTQLMNDPSKFGIGKSLMSSGIAAGFDMTTQAGLDAFKQQHNQNLKANSPPNLDALLENLGTENTSGLTDFISALLGKIQGDNAPDNAPDNSPIPSIAREMQELMWLDQTDGLPELSPAAIELLTQQSISATAPGTILTDFQTLLDFVRDGILVSNNIHTLPQKSLADLNQLLSQPIQLGLKRPVQQSYPSIDGLYLLLINSGLGCIRDQGNKKILVLDPKLLALWHDFNLTERYFMLLETWMVRANAGILGTHRSSFHNECSKCFQYWRRLPDAGEKYPTYADQKQFAYYPSPHNLALLQIFGFLDIETGTPEAGNGWRVERVQKLPFGDAMMMAIFQAFTAAAMWWESEDDPDLPFAELQPTFQPYFPEWQRTF